MRRGVLSLVVLSLLLSGVVLAGGGTSIVEALTQLKNVLCGVFGSLVVVLIVLAAVAYSAGHILGQETGARAKVWGQNILIGAGIAAVIYILAPIILGALTGNPNIIVCSPTTP